MRIFVVSIFILISAVFCRLDRHFFKLNASFCLNRVLPKWSMLSQVETLPPKDLSSALSQPFHYLSKGEQCFVFVSEDERWVIKLFRLPRFAKKVSFRRDRKPASQSLESFTCYKAAYEELSDLTQVEYAHLSETQFLNCALTVVDALGVIHETDLDSTPFLLQRFGTLYLTQFDTYTETQQKKQLVYQTLLLFGKLYDRGYEDGDSSFCKNFGVLNGQPFLLDVGFLKKTRHRVSQRDFVRKAMSPLVETFDPELTEFYHKSLAIFSPVLEN